MSVRTGAEEPDPAPEEVAAAPGAAEGPAGRGDGEAAPEAEAAGEPEAPVEPTAAAEPDATADAPAVEEPAPEGDAEPDAATDAGTEPDAATAEASAPAEGAPGPAASAPQPAPAPDGPSALADDTAADGEPAPKEDAPAPDDGPVTEDQPAPEEQPATGARPATDDEPSTDDGPVAAAAPAVDGTAAEDAAPGAGAARAPAPTHQPDDLGTAAAAEPPTAPEARDHREEGRRSGPDGARDPATAAEPAATPAQPAPAAEPTAAEPAGPTTGRQRLLAALRPRATRAQLLSGLLCLLLGLALVTQLRERTEADLASLRQSELIALLDDTTERADRLQQEVRELSGTRDELLSSSDQTEAARELARERLDVLGVLAGTVPATGPGIELTISGGEVDADVLLAAVQEMRDAGAEAIQLGEVRVVARTYFVDAEAPGGGRAVEVDGVLLEAPFAFRAIGSAATLASAMGFPGGVVETVEAAGGTAVVAQREVVEVTALRAVEEPAYARPAAPSTEPPAAASP